MTLSDHGFYLLSWIYWFLRPWILVLILPALFLLFFYGVAIFLHVYERRQQLREVYSDNFWDGALHTVSTLLLAHARLWHGYDIRGLSHLPRSGPALLIWYHGPLPTDYYYINASILTRYRRKIYTVADRFLYKIPGWKKFTEVFQLFPGSVEECVSLLEAGEMVAISPGGVFEAQFADSDSYDVLWRKRIGYAKISHHLNNSVPVYPIFTRNIREAYRAVSYGRRFFLRLYEKTRLPLAPIYGGFPVKMISYVGPPIRLERDMTLQQTADAIREGVISLIRCHQRLPGSIMRGLWERVRPGPDIVNNNNSSSDELDTIGRDELSPISIEDDDDVGDDLINGDVSHDRTS